MEEAWRLVYNIIEGHRSIRKYKRVELPREHVEALERAAQRAPTDATLHLWTAIRISDQDKRRIIAEKTGQRHIWEASLFYVFIADLYRLYRILEEHGVNHSRNDHALLLFAAIDAALAAENMAVTAEAMGYGTCFIGAIQNIAEDLIDLLSLPQKTLPLFGLTIGVPDEDPPRRPRLPLSMLIHEDAYRTYTREEIDEGVRIMNRITRSGRWIRILSRYAGEGGYFEERGRSMERLLRRQGFNT